jgi:hypothetical protein
MQEGRKIQMSNILFEEARDIKNAMTVSAPLQIYLPGILNCNLT